MQTVTSEHLLNETKYCEAYLVTVGILFKEQFICSIYMKYFEIQ